MDVLREAIRQSGGLATAGALGKRWGVSRTRVKELIAMPGFPKAIELVGSGQKVYPVQEADDFRGYDPMREARAAVAAVASREEGQDT